MLGCNLLRLIGHRTSQMIQFSNGKLGRISGMSFSQFNRLCMEIFIHFRRIRRCRGCVVFHCNTRIAEKGADEIWKHDSSFSFAFHSKKCARSPPSWSFPLQIIILKAIEERPRHYLYERISHQSIELALSTHKSLFDYSFIYLHTFIFLNDQFHMSYKTKVQGKKNYRCNG